MLAGTRVARPCEKFPDFRKSKKCFFLQLHARKGNFFGRNTTQHSEMDSNMVGAAGVESEMAQVKITFTTTDNDFQLPESKRQLLVPAGTSLSLQQEENVVNGGLLTQSE